MNIDQVLRCADLHPDNSVRHILAAEVRRLSKENKKLTTWKDIADAPKDGTEILMLRPSGKRIVVWWDANGWKSGDGVGHLALTPHAKWMHLPEATP